MCLSALLQVLACSILFLHPAGMDPSLVDPPPSKDGPNAPPSPFQRIDPHGPAFRAFLPLCALGVAIAALGAVAALLRHPLGLKLYGIAAFLHFLCAAPLAPSALLATALATVMAPIALADRLYARLTLSYVMLSSSSSSSSSRSIRRSS